MIVVDTNVISYLLLPTPHTEAAEALLRKEPVWAAPLLWRSEFRNVLTLCLRKGLVRLDQALALQERAEGLLHGNEFQATSMAVLSLAHESGCSAYDCEFVVVARDLGVGLVTADKALLRSFPGLARSLSNGA